MSLFPISEVISETLSFFLQKDVEKKDFGNKIDFSGRIKLKLKRDWFSLFERAEKWERVKK